METLNNILVILFFFVYYFFVKISRHDKEKLAMLKGFNNVYLRYIKAWQRCYDNPLQKCKRKK